MRSRRSMKLLIGSLVMAFACVCCSTTDVTIEDVASDQQELRDSIESPFLEDSPTFPTEPFELSSSTARTYNDFILKLRNRLKSTDGLAKFNIPMSHDPNKITDSNRFLLVKLSNKEQKTTLAVRVSDGYVVGFCCGKRNENAKKETAWFFKPENQIFKKQNELLFQDKGIMHEEFGFTGNYGSLGNRAIPLGRKPMTTSIGDLAETEKKKNMDAVQKALVVLIQMVCEATRYRYISDKVALVIGSYNLFTPDTLMLSYQNNWGSLSEAVATSYKDGKFKKAVVFPDNNGTKTVTNVSQIQNHLSLLAFVKTL